MLADPVAHDKERSGSATSHIATGDFRSNKPVGRRIGVAIEYEVHGRTSARSLLPSAVLVFLPVSMLLVAAGYVLLPLLLDQHRPEVLVGARIYLFFVPVHGMVALSSGVLLGVAAFRSWNLFRSLPPLAWLATLGTFAAVGVQGAAQVSTTYLVAISLLIPVSMWLALRLTPRASAAPSGELARDLLRFGAPAAPASVPLLLNLRLDQVAMSALVPASQLGLYAAAVSWSGALTPVLAATAPIILPFLARTPATTYSPCMENFSATGY